MVGAVAESWVEAVRSKFADVGVNSLREFVRDIRKINRRLAAIGDTQLHATTLDMMLEEAVEAVEWPEEG